MKTIPLLVIDAKFYPWVLKATKWLLSLLDVPEMHATGPGPQERGFFRAFFVQGFRFEPAAGSLLHEARPSQSAVLGHLSC